MSAILSCIKVSNKLRCIPTSGYHNNANFQFPRNIRRERRFYSVPISNIILIQGPSHKYFYRDKKNNISILEDNVQQPDKIYETEDDPLCIVCMDKEKSVVYTPCGHYYCCDYCTYYIKIFNNADCPICRTQIVHVIKREDIQL